VGGKERLGGETKARQTDCWKL